MKKIVLVLMIFVLSFMILSFLAVSFYIMKKGDLTKSALTHMNTIFSIPTPISGHIGEDMSQITPVPPKEITHDAVLSPGQSAQVQCGDGRDGTEIAFDRGVFSGNLNLGDQTEISISIKDVSHSDAGALVEWRLSNYGTLEIDGCHAIFIAPGSIGSAYQVSAQIQAHPVREIPKITQVIPGGEGGPASVSVIPYTNISIYNTANNTHINNSTKTYCNSGYTYNYSTQKCCPNNVPYYYNGAHGIYAIGCYITCPYIGDCSEKTTRY